MSKKNTVIKKGLSLFCFLLALLAIVSLAQLHQLIENNHRAQSTIKKEWINNDPAKERKFKLYQYACVFHKETDVTFTRIIDRDIGTDPHEVCAKEARMSDYYRLIKRSQKQLQPAFPLNLIVSNFDVITNV